MKEYTSYKKGLKPAVIEEAIVRFRTKGIKAVKMDDIARNLGISKRTLYELYPNKEDVLIEVIRQQYESRKTSIVHFCDGSNDVMDLLLEVLGLQLEAATNTCSEFYRDLQRYPKAEKVLMGYYESERKSAEEFFGRGVKAGYFIPEINYSIMQAIMASTMKMLRTSEEFADVSYKDLFLNFLYPSIRGICTAQGVERIDEFVRQRF